MKGEWGIGIGSKAKRAAETVIKNGSVTSEVNNHVAEPFGFFEWVFGCIKVIAQFLLENDEVFIIICMVGMIIVIAGKEDLGKKITSGGFIGFIVAKVVSEWQ